jgi:hypothetical protein
VTAQELIQEGRKLQRPCFFLYPEPHGEVAAIWHDDNAREVEETGFQCWLTVDARFIPNLPKSIKGYISVYSEGCTDGKVEVSRTMPNRGGVKLYAYPAKVIPPIDAVIARGSEKVDEWLKANNWSRDIRYNNNFNDQETARAYQKIWFKEFPPYSQSSDVYAILGGWHWPGQDDDWHDLIDEQLMVLTVRDSEPWVEAWHLRNGEFKVIPRIT